MKKKMYSLLLVLSIMCSATVYAQVVAEADSVIVSNYFETIRQDENRLRQFFAQMPKGGDLHNHLTGSAYAETYFRLAAEDRLWVDMTTGKLYQEKDSGLIQLSPDMKNLHNTRMALIDKWSIRNFNPEKFSLGPDEYFFGTFGLFGAVTGKHNAELLRELRERAAYENVQYLEVMVSSPGITAEKLNEICGSGFYEEYNKKLKDAIRTNGVNKIDSVLNSIMDNENIDLHHARIEAGFESNKVSEAAERLEYYGKVLPNSVVDPQIDYPKNDEEIYGKIANPTVHAALNQLRKVVNELLELYGRPEQIVIELARDLKNSRKAKDLIKKKNAENKKLNEEVDKIIQEYSEQYHTQIVKNKLNRDKIKLWLELGDDILSRKCIYTGEQISISKLFSDDVQIEHIVPYSKTLDDSMNNKTLSMKKANYYKGNRTPCEAFKDNKDGYNYEAILERAKQLNNSSKFKRFTKEALDIVLGRRKKRCRRGPEKE